MKKLGLINKNEKGFFKSTDKIITTGEIIRNAIIEQYQIKTLDRAKERIVGLPEKHLTATINFSASAEALNLIIKKINILKKEVRSISHKDESKHKKVYEIIIHTHSQTQ